MIRFFCTVCNKVKRVRKMPGNVATATGPVQNRLGRCRFHGLGDGKSRADLNSRARVTHVSTHVKKTEAPKATPKKGKK